MHATAARRRQSSRGWGDRGLSVVPRRAAPVEQRPLLHLALSGESDALRAALDAEVRAEQAKDRAYWAPLKAELEDFRLAEREGSGSDTPQ